MHEHTRDMVRNCLYQVAKDDEPFCVLYVKMLGNYFYHCVQKTQQMDDLPSGITDRLH